MIFWTLSRKFKKLARGRKGADGVFVKIIFTAKKESMNGKEGVCR